VSSTTTTSTTTVAATSSTTVAYQTPAQYGFFFDQSRCTNCMACAIACKSYKRIPAGPSKPLRMVNWETGTFPQVRLNFLMIHCFHCANPVCITAAVQAGAPGLYKEPKYGAVLLDPNFATQMRAAAAACPYGAIVFDSDAPDATATKCDMCVARLEQGRMPICVMACNLRALDFDTMANLKKKYGSLADLNGLPNSSLASPSLVVKPADAKKQLVPYDPAKVLTLMAKRDPLPAVYTDPTLITNLPAGLVGRSKPVVKPANVGELVKSSQSDEG